jgi:hypothetical protein
MRFSDLFKAFVLVPQSRKHLLKVISQLQQFPKGGYQSLLQENYQFNSIHSKQRIAAIVKSYFWACRLIKECRCLPRSIALYQYLKASGYQVEHKFGVNKSDNNLAAHAWVEYLGEPLNESEDLYSRFSVLK